jgi:hypothetical protein
VSKKYAFILALAVSIQPVVGAETPVWTMSTLVGKANAHHGANCFNATLVAKGYADEIAFTGIDQMKFYLAKFCSPSSRPIGQGDILTLTTRDGELVHAALALGDGKIFEKESGDGLFSNYLGMDPHYHIRGLKDSPLFKNMHEDGYDLSSYRCQDARSVRQQLASCERRADQAGFKSVRKALEKNMLTSSQDISLSAEALSSAKKIASALGKMSTGDPCFEHFQVWSGSITEAFEDLSLADPAFARFAGQLEWKQAVSEIREASRKCELSLTN